MATDWLVFLGGAEGFLWNRGSFFLGDVSGGLEGLPLGGELSVEEPG